MRDLRKEAAPTRRGVGAKSPAQHERKKLLPFARGIREVMLDPLKAQRVSLGPEVQDSKTASGFGPYTVRRARRSRLPSQKKRQIASFVNSGGNPAWHSENGTQMPNLRQGESILMTSALP